MTVHQERRDDGVVVAVKAARAADAVRLDHEAAVLDGLTGCAVPAVLARGDGRLELSWRYGIEVRRAAGEAREAGDRGALLDMCVPLLRAYAEIHSRGVVHGNVHPRHVLVDRDGSVSVLDFAPARPSLGTLSPPAQAEAWLAGGGVVAPDPRDEQYSVAALLYLLLTGRMYFRAALSDRRTLARQILVESPLPFTEHGVAAWPEVETALARALRKKRAARFESVGGLAGALVAGAGAAGRGSPAPRFSALDEQLEQFRTLTRLDGPLLPRGLMKAPTCSVNYGASGIAFALYRLARAGEDAGTLDAALAWLDVAERESGSAGAFYSDAMGLTPESVGAVSPYRGSAISPGRMRSTCTHRRNET
jgi:hypothetical protein